MVKIKVKLKENSRRQSIYLRPGVMITKEFIEVDDSHPEIETLILNRNDLIITKASEKNIVDNAKSNVKENIKEIVTEKKKEDKKETKDQGNKKKFTKKSK